MNKQKYAFTLVELIVVITILAILGTIAFISLQWYSKDARDSIRISDTSNMKTSLELFHLDSGKYPLPDDNEIVDYGTETLWYQWDFWSSVISSLSRSMSEIPTDPLTDKEYIFSVANNKNEFEISNLLEWDSLALSNISQTNAASLEVTPKVDWNFNRVFIKTANYIVPVPSIITSEILLWTMTLDSNNISSQVVNGWENIPEQWNVLSNTWALTWLILSVYTWSIAIDDSNSIKEDVIQKIQAAYTWSVLASSDIYNYILSISWEDETASLLNSIVLNDDSTEITPSWNSCDDTTKPADDLNKTYTVNPTSSNQAYIQDDAECWYACTWWFTWVNCEIAPDPYLTCTWVNTPTPFSAVTTYPLCDTADVTICTWVWIWYTIAWCNVWATAWSEYALCVDLASCPIARTWELFQWWNNEWLRDSTISPTQISVTATWSTYNGSGDFIYNFADWNSTPNNDAWWYIWWSDINMKWPCETWYRIPIHSEWAWIHTAWWWGDNWVDSWTNMANDLKLPMAWRRDWNNWSVVRQWSHSYYWASWTTGTNAYLLNMTLANIAPTHYDYRAYGHSIRCIKN